MKRVCEFVDLKMSLAALSSIDVNKTATLFGCVL